jgi:hypothetical protein
MLTTAPHPLATARFPEQDAGYESWFIRAADPAGGRAIWLRYTVHRAPGHAPVGSLWLTRFDREGGAPLALKQSFAGRPPSTGDDATYVGIGDATIGVGLAVGAIRCPQGDATWSIAFDTGEPPAIGLPAEAMYGWPFPRAKPVSLHPAVTLHGELLVAGQRLDVDGWRGCVGHNWGPEHTPEWVWLQAVGLGGDPDVWLDAAFGKVRVGPLLTPWLGSGWLHVDGKRHRLGDARHFRATRVQVRDDGCTFRLAGAGLTVDGHVNAPAGGAIAWRYSDPADTGRTVVHHSLSDLQLTVTGSGQAPRSFALTGAAGFEHGSPRPAPGVTAAPFTDP